jgi:Methylamine utilisation protein MauE
VRGAVTRQTSCAQTPCACRCFFGGALVSAVFESALRIVLAVLFLLAALHKGRMLARGRARDEPLIAGSAFRERYAEWLLAGVALIEIALAASLIVAPALATAASALVLVSYAIDLRRLPPQESCRCFGDAFGRSSARSAQFRNMILGVMSGSAAAAMLLRGSAAPLRVETGLGAALIVFAIAAALSSGGFTSTRREVRQ